MPISVTLKSLHTAPGDFHGFDSPLYVLTDAETQQYFISGKSYEEVCPLPVVKKRFVQSQNAKSKISRCHRQPKPNLPVYQ